MQNKSHSVRVRGHRWADIEKKAWDLSIQAQRVVKPTDVVDALLVKGLGELNLDDIKQAKSSRLG